MWGAAQAVYKLFWILFSLKIFVLHNEWEQFYGEKTMSVVFIVNQLVLGINLIQWYFVDSNLSTTSIYICTRSICKLKAAPIMHSKKCIFFLVKTYEPLSLCMHSLFCSKHTATVSLLGIASHFNGDKTYKWNYVTFSSQHANFLWHIAQKRPQKLIWFSYEPEA